MSAYIVEDSTINTITTIINEIITGNDRIFHKYSNLYNYYHAEYIVIADLCKRGPEALGTALYELNCKAVSYRYGEDQRERFNRSTYNYKPEIEGNPYQIIKTITCYMYQCTEGTIIEDTLYKELTELRKDLCLSLVKNDEKYENARWS